MRRVHGTTQAQRHYPEEGTMTVTLEERVEVLEGKVDNLETWAGPGQNDAFSRNLAEFRQETNAKLTGLTTKVDKLQGDVTGLQADVTGLRTDVTGLQADVTGLRTDVTGLQADVTGLRTDFTELKTEVTELKVDFVGFTNHVRGELAGIDNTLYSMRSDVKAVKGTLAEILDRLPPKAA
jgi:hypothetical protein